MGLLDKGSHRTIEFWKASVLAALLGGAVGALLALL